MNLNYSYRSFLITSLLLGILVLFLYSVKLSSQQAEEEETFNMELLPESLMPEEPEIASLTQEQVKVETNRAFNEAEKFISEVENENRETTETTEGKLQEMRDAMEDSKNSDNGTGTSVITKPEKEKKTKFSNSDSKKNGEAVVESGNRNTTISYRLLNRKDLLLPNPVYTCFGSGKVVINIEVNALGRVINGSYNKSSSSTANECLIDSALEYATQARFTTDSSRDRQLGTITFNFPGQQ